MAQIIGLPKLSPTMEEGVLVRWVKKEGDAVSPGDLVAEVETDKANMDFNLEDEGTLLKLLVKEGDTVKLGAPVAILGKPGEDVSGLLAQASGLGPRASGLSPAGAAASPAPAASPPPPAASPPPAAANQPPPAAQKPPQPAVAAPAPAPSGTGTGAPAAGGGKLLASPLAKSLALELGVDLRNVTGSGPGGRVVERDVRAAAQAGPAQPRPAAEQAPAPPAAAAPSEPANVALVKTPPASPAIAGEHDDYVDHPASNMRKRIAARLTEAKRDVPHFYLMRRIDPEALVGFRARLNKLLGDRGKVSINDLIIKAVALSLRRMPECNAAWIGDAIRVFSRVHVGVAVAIEDGLVTPVVRDADRKGLSVIAGEVADLAKRARERHLKAHEISGSTFTVSNLGMYDIERFTAIINPPEAGILAIGGIVDEPVVKDGAVVAGKRMTLTMSCDHRVIDGALGARFLQVVVEQLEQPESLAL